MDLLSTKWSSQIEMNDSSINHEWQNMMMSSLEYESFDFKPFITSTTNNNITTNDYYNQNSNNNNYISHQKPWKIDGAIEKASSNNSSASSTIISFGNIESPRVNSLEKKKSSSSSSSSLVENHEISNMENMYAPLEFGEMKRGVVRTPEQAQDHVLAERKRREKMTQKFVVLSTLIPGLKKLDKATVLGDAINYIKELQGRVKELEVEVKGNQKEESITIIRGAKRPRLDCSYDNEVSSYDENNLGDLSSENETSQEIEVRASRGNVMIRVYCKNKSGVIKDVMGEIEKHNLLMISSSVMPFGVNSLHMTIIAQMDAECELTPKDLADNLRRSILNVV